MSIAKNQKPVVPDGRKWCGACKSVKPVVEFGVSKSRSDGLAPRCKACDRESEAIVVDHLYRVRQGLGLVKGQG